MRAKRPLFWLGVTSLLAAGCGSDDSEGGSAEEAIEPLDPTAEHFGRSYSEWAGEWWRWLMEMPQREDCIDPATDATGERCSLGQEEDSSVFFLAGTTGGTVMRTECAIPEGKALFFPFVTGSHDNGGVPEDSVQTDVELRESAQADLELMPTSELLLSIDGRSVSDLEGLRIEAAPYEYTVPPPPNTLECFGVPDVTGTYQGYASGYFALLPPLEPGEHVIEFRGLVEGDPDPFIVHAIYDPLTVE